VIIGGQPICFADAKHARCALRAPIQGPSEGAMSAAVVPDVFPQDSYATRIPWADCCIRTAQVFVKRCTLFGSRSG
jgi:hypothetical protein